MGRSVTKIGPAIPMNLGGMERPAGPEQASRPGCSTMP